MGNTTYSKAGKSSDVETLNAAEQGTRKSALEGVMNTANNYDNLIKSLTTGGKGYETNITAAADSFDPTAATNYLMSISPQMAEFANRAAAGSLSEYGSSAEELAKLSTRNALRTTAGQLAAGGLLNSGAANASLMEAALKPQQEMQTLLAGKQSDASMGLLNNLLGIGGSALTAGYSQEGAQNLDAAKTLASNWLTSKGLESGALASQGGLYGTLADLTQQQYWQPEYSENANFLDYLTAGGSLLTGLTGGAGFNTAKDGATTLTGLPALLKALKLIA